MSPVKTSAARKPKGTSFCNNHNGIGFYNDLLYGQYQDPHQMMLNLPAGDELFTQQELISFVDSCVEEVKTRCSRYKHASFTEIQEKYEKNCEEFRQLLQQMIEGETYGQFIQRIVVQGAPSGTVYAYRHVLLTVENIITAVISCLREIALLDDTLKQLEKNKELLLIMNHRIASGYIEYLKKLGYKTVAAHDCLIEVAPMQMHYNIPPAFEKNIKCLYQMLVQNTHKKLKLQPIEAVNAPDTCLVCFKDIGQMFLCSRCLKACYCSKECQTLDWKNKHRQECSKK